MNTVMIVSGAYGRDYKTAKAAKAAWETGKDFMCRTMEMNGLYCSIRDFPKDKAIELRYNKERELVMVNGASELNPSYDCDGAY